MSDLVTLLLEAEALKDVARAGWARVPASARESVAEHTYGVAALAVLLGPELGVDAGRLARLAVVHDLAEARVGDITPEDGVAREEKRRREREALTTMLAPLGHPGEELLELAREYEEGATPEGRLLKELDGLELLLQAYRQERVGADRGSLDPFWASGLAKLRHPKLLEIARELEVRRRALLKAP